MRLQTFTMFYAFALKNNKKGNAQIARTHEDDKHDSSLLLRQSEYHQWEEADEEVGEDDLAQNEENSDVEIDAMKIDDGDLIRYFRGLLLSFKAYEIFSRTKRFPEIFKLFSLEQWDFQDKFIP